MPASDAALESSTAAMQRARWLLFVNALLGGDFSSLDIGITTLTTWVNRKTRHQASIADGAVPLAAYGDR